MTTAIPKLSAMLVCDHIITEQGSNKKSLIGIFENISAAQYPATHPALSVYVKLKDAHGSYQFRLTLIDLTNETNIANCPISDEVHIRNPLQSHELVFNLRGLKFPHAGDYEFRIFANDCIFGQTTFAVHEIRDK